MSEDIQLSIIVAITIVCLALIGRGCHGDMEREATKRLLGTNTVLKGEQ